MLLLRETRPQEVGVPEALTADKTKSTSEGKPRNINELGATGSGFTPTTAQQVTASTAPGGDPEKQVYIWMLTQPSTNVRGLMLLELVGSGAAVFACPPSFVGNNVNLTSSGLKLRSGSGAKVNSSVQPASRRSRGIKRTTSASRWQRSVANRLCLLAGGCGRATFEVIRVLAGICVGDKKIRPKL